MFTNIFFFFNLHTFCRYFYYCRATLNPGRPGLFFIQAQIYIQSPYTPPPQWHILGGQGSLTIFDQYFLLKGLKMGSYGG